MKKPITFLVCLLLFCMTLPAYAKDTIKSPVDSSSKGASLSTITTSPVSNYHGDETAVVLQDGKAVLTVEASTTASNPDLTYQWYTRDPEWSGGTVNHNDIEQIIPICTSDASTSVLTVYQTGDYFCRVEDNNGEVRWVDYEVVEFITVTNEDVVIMDGTSIVLDVPEIVGSSGEYTYQWYKGYSYLNDDTSISQVTVTEPDRYECYIHDKKPFSSSSYRYKIRVLAKEDETDLQTLTVGSNTMSGTEAMFIPAASGFYTFDIYTSDYLEVYDYSMYQKAADYKNGYDRNIVYDRYISSWRGNDEDYSFASFDNASLTRTLYYLEAGNTYYFVLNKGAGSVVIKEPDQYTYRYRYTSPNFQFYQTGTCLSVEGDSGATYTWYNSEDMEEDLVMFYNKNYCNVYEPGLYECQISYPNGLILKAHFEVAGSHMSTPMSVGASATLENVSCVDRDYNNSTYYFPVQVDETGTYRISLNSNKSGCSWKASLVGYDMETNGEDVLFSSDVYMEDQYDDIAESYVGEGRLKAGVRYLIKFSDIYSNYSTPQIDNVTVRITRTDAHEHEAVSCTDLEATCTSYGLSGGSYCSICKCMLSETALVNMAPHEMVQSYDYSYATPNADGMTASQYCYNCYYNIKGTVIPRISEYKLSSTTYVYDGKSKKPTVTVKDRTGKTLVNGTDYSVSYASGRTKVGKYKVTIDFDSDNYYGTKTLTFTINPKPTTLGTVSALKKGFKVSWKKMSTETTGYQLQYATSSKFTSAKSKTISSYKTTSQSITKLSGGKKYYVRIRPYKTVSGTKYYSAWSKAKTVTTKK